MGRNAKVGIAAAVVLVLTAITFLRDMPPMVPIAVVVIGGIGIFFLLRQDDDEGEERPKKVKKGKARLDEILDDQAKGTTTTTTTKRPITPAAPPSGGLPTWSPGSIDTSATIDDLVVGEPATDDTLDVWNQDWSTGESDTLILDDDPLSSLDRLDDIDPVAEVERLDADADDDPFASLRTDFESDTIELDELDVELDEPEPAPSSSSSSSGFSFSGAPKVINEEVTSADDIMAASTATELHVDEAGDSELARLLAKVQARLSAYE